MKSTKCVNGLTYTIETSLINHSYSASVQFPDGSISYESGDLDNLELKINIDFQLLEKIIQIISHEYGVQK